MVQDEKYVRMSGLACGQRSEEAIDGEVGLEPEVNDA